MSIKRIQVAAVVLRDAEGKVLTVRKRGTSRFMLPGGKPEPGEQPRQTALREVQEEIGLEILPDALVALGRFTAPAANEPDHQVISDAFVAEDLDQSLLLEELRPAAEIEEIRWSTLDDLLTGTDVAPLLSEQIIPALTR